MTYERLTMEKRENVDLHLPVSVRVRVQQELDGVGFVREFRLRELRPKALQHLRDVLHRHRKGLDGLQTGRWRRDCVLLRSLNSNGNHTRRYRAQDDPVALAVLHFGSKVRRQVVLIDVAQQVAH